MDDEDSTSLLDRDFERFEGYWHGATFIIFDPEAPADRWVQSTRWVPVAGVKAPDHPDHEGQPD